MNNKTLEILRKPSVDALVRELKSECGLMTSRLSTERAAALGRVVGAFQRLECQVKQFIGFQLGADDSAGAIVIAKLSFRNLLTTLCALSSERGFSDHQKLIELSSAADRAEDIRNQLVHSLWTSGPRVKWEASRKDGLVITDEDYSEHDLGEIEKYITGLTNGFSTLMLRFLKEKAKNIPSSSITETENPEG